MSGTHPTQRKYGILGWPDGYFLISPYWMALSTLRNFLTAVINGRGPRPLLFSVDLKKKVMKNVRHFWCIPLSNHRYFLSIYYCCFCKNQSDCWSAVRFFLLRISCQFASDHFSRCGNREVQLCNWLASPHQMEDASGSRAYINPDYSTFYWSLYQTELF